MRLSLAVKCLIIIIASVAVSEPFSPFGVMGAVLDTNKAASATPVIASVLPNVAKLFLAEELEAAARVSILERSS